MKKINLGYLTKSLLLCGVLSTTMLTAWASDNLLHAIQVNEINGVGNVILKSDENSEIKKTIQSPNKMFLDLKGISASKTINTIYSSGTNIDSIIVENKGKDSLRIYIQGENIDELKVGFDSLKTPLGTLKSTSQSTEKVVLNSPIEAYKPVYNNFDEVEEESSMASSFSLMAETLKGLAKNDKISWTVTFGLLSIIFLSGLKGILNKNQNTRIGLGVSNIIPASDYETLKNREMDKFRDINSRNLANPQSISNINAPIGIKTYQKTTRSPYMTTGLPQKRVTIPTAQDQMKPQKASSSVQTAEFINELLKKPERKPNATNPNRSVDSMKFLESMSKIYEKTGRKDLAQGLKSSIRKAQES